MLFDPKWEQETKVSPARAILIAARKLIEKPEHWCQHTFARAKDGSDAHELSDDAYAFCMRGAVNRAVGQYQRSDCDAIQHLFAVSEAITGKRSISGLNDTRSHAEVLAAFDRAIAAA